MQVLNFMCSFFESGAQKHKKDIQAVSLISLSRSARVKAACRTLMKLIPNINYIFWPAEK